MQFVIFFSIFGTIYFGIHFLVYFVLTNKLILIPRLQAWLKLFLWFSGLSFIAGNILSRSLKFHLLKDYGQLWFGIVSILFFILLAGYIVTFHFPSHSKSIIQVALILAFGMMIFSYINFRMGPIIKKISLEYNKLPDQLNGFTIVQLSDIHLENSSGTGALKHMVSISNGLKPDLVVITGDLLDEQLDEKTSFHEVLKTLNPTYGTIAITGNHEFFAGVSHFESFARMSGITVLRDDVKLIAPQLSVIGLDDISPRMNGSKKNLLPDLIQKIPDDHFKLLLNHTPGGFKEARTNGIDLQLSGHTHSGQFFPYNFFIHLFFKYTHGLYREGAGYIYTSCGTGVWGPPFRSFKRSEVVLITLLKSN